MGLLETFKEVGYWLLFITLGFLCIIGMFLVAMYIKNSTIGGLLIFILFILAIFFFAVAKKISKRGL